MFKSILAVDISDSSIEALEFSKFLGRIKIKFLSRVELENGIVDKGRILDRKELILKLKEYLGGVKSKNVALALPDAIVFNGVLRFDAAMQITVERVLFEAKKSLPLNLEDCYFDFAIQEADKEKVVFFAAALKKDVDQYKSVFEELKLSPRYFDLHSLCSLRAMDFRSDNGTLAIDMGGRRSMLNILDNNVLQATRIVDFGGDNFTERLSEKLKVPYERAKDLKMNVGFDPDKEDGRVFLVLQEVLQPLIGEIRKTLNLYEEEKKKSIKKIVLFGGSALMPHVDEYIFENLGIKTEIARPIFNELVVGYLAENKMPMIDAMFFSSAIGLAARYFGVQSRVNVGVNLLK